MKGRSAAPPGAVSRAFGFALGLLMPPQCLGCGAPVDAPGRVCASCWSGIRLLGPPQCAICGLPFEVAADEGALCGACVRHPPPFSQARAVFAYEGVGRRLVLGLKLADRTHGVPALASWMARTGAPLIAEADLIVPVPLHRWRLFGRRFNQAALLAQAIARANGVAVLADGLARVRATPSQTSLSASARVRNVRGAFRVAAGRRARIAGRRVLLVDDVMTTGATAAACARALRAAGAEGVTVLTLARTLRLAA